MMYHMLCIGDIKHRQAPTLIGRDMTRQGVEGRGGSPDWGDGASQGL